MFVPANNSYQPQDAVQEIFEVFGKVQRGRFSMNERKKQPKSLKISDAIRVVFEEFGCTPTMLTRTYIEGPWHRGEAITSHTPILRMSAGSNGYLKSGWLWTFSAKTPGMPTRKLLTLNRREPQDSPAPTKAKIFRAGMERILESYVMASSVGCNVFGDKLEGSDRDAMGGFALELHALLERYGFEGTINLRKRTP